MSNVLYWLGLYAADLVLLLLPFLLFCVFVLITQIDGFFQELGSLMIIILSFGAALIALVYLISTAFHDPVTAGKCIGPVLIIMGNVLPLMVIPWFFGFQEEIGLFIVGVVYFSNPFCTFFVNAYDLLISYFNGSRSEEMKE